MSYYIATTLRLPFDEAIARTEAALKKEGFGIISRIDIQEALKMKIGVHENRSSPDAVSGVEPTRPTAD